MASSRGETLFENTTSRLRVCAFFPGFSDLKKYLEGELHLCRVNLVQMNQSLRILPVGGENESAPPPLKRVGFDHDDDEEEGERIAAKSILYSGQRVWREKSRQTWGRERVELGYGLMGQKVGLLTHFDMV